MKRALLVCLLLVVSATTFAVPISYTFTGSYDYTYFTNNGSFLTEHSGSYSGIYGSEYRATVVFDNGGQDLKNTVWTADDFLYITYESGDFSAVYNSLIFADFRNFVADEDGVIVDGFIEIGGGDHGVLWFDVHWGEVNSFSSSGFGAMGNGNSLNPLRSERGRILPISEPGSPIALYLVALGVICCAGFRLQDRRQGFQGTLAVPT